MPVIIINVYLRFQSVGFFQASPDAIPGSKDMQRRLIGDAAPPKLSVSFILWYFGKQRWVMIWARPGNFCQNFFPPVSAATTAEPRSIFLAWGRFS